MSDNEEFLGDDFGDPGVDDTYNLGNEEEDILLAGGNISDCVLGENNDVYNAKSSENQNVPHVKETTKLQNAQPTNKSSNVEDKQPPTAKNQAEDNVKSACETEATLATETATGDYRYRADHKERFPTERSETHGTNLPVIPDSLDTVVTTEEFNPQFRNRKQNNRGRRMNNQRPMKRPDFQRSPNINQLPPNESRSFPPDFRPYPRDMPMNRGMRPRMPMHPNDYNPRGDFNPSNNPNFLPRLGPGHMRFMNDIRPPFQPHPRPFHDSGLENIGPNNIRTSVDLRSGAATIHREFRPTIPQSSPRNFNQFPENFINQNDKNVFHPELRQQDDNMRHQNNRFPPQSRMGENPGNFGPRGFDQMLRQKQGNGPPFNNNRNYSDHESNMNLPSGFAPRDLDKKGLNEQIHPGAFDPQFPPKGEFFKTAPPNETKKVHINPHFKGVVPPDFMQQSHESFNDRYPNRNFNSFAGNNVNPQGEIDGFMQNRTHSEYINNQIMGASNRIGFNDKPVNEKELDRLTEQFINEQQRCLQRANADYYEKTQRFIENTSLTVRNQPVDEERERKKEYLKRKQEEFINENDKLLNLRRRRVSPPRVAHRSPPPVVRHRTSPYKKPRGRTSLSPPQQRREQSGEPEDRAYRVKLREQAEMRARVLQAKERRRRRDAATLVEKMNQPTPVLSKQDNKSSIEPPINNKRMDDTSRSFSSNQIDEDKHSYKASWSDNKTPTFDDKCSKSPPFDDKPDAKANDKTVDDEKQSSIGETLEDMLEDDLLRLSPEDEELLLSDEEDLILPISFSKTLTSTENSENKPATSIVKSTKDSAKTTSILSNLKTTTSIKRLANYGTKDDLRSKIKKNNDNNAPQTSTSLNASPRRKITFSHENKDVSTKSQLDGEVKADKKESERGNTNKWRSTFSEQKLDLTAPVAARAISAVMRNTNDGNRKTVVISKSNKSTSSQLSTDQENEKSSNKIHNGNAAEKSWNGRQVVLGISGRRVVIPPRQKPLVVVENDEDEILESHVHVAKQEKSKINKKTAQVTGLPPGMTEARLLSLCGPEVEHVTVGAAGSADVSFSSADACDRFVRRFHGRLVAACRLSVTASN